MRSRFHALLVFAVAALLASAAPAQESDNYRVLPNDFGADKTQQMMRAYLRGQVHDALDARQTQLENALGSLQTFSAYQRAKRDFLRRTFRLNWNRGPLAAQVTGVIEANGYTIEKVLFQSHGGFYVTANFYRPDGDGPFPAILHPCGHSENGKAAEAYQLANQLLALNGFAVLCFDPIGQAERKQIFDQHNQPALRGSQEHQQLGVAPILLGHSLASFMVWDAVRAIDYLCSRPDVDPQRIGCTGNSGGGNLTSYMMAYDDRIAAAAPGCFVTIHRLKNESPGPGDAEQNLFAQIRQRFDHPDFILVRAPKPTLILAATKDFVPIDGTWEAFRQAKRGYSLLGYPERIDLVEANEKHGFSRRLREAAVRFFARWLQGRQIEVFEEQDDRLEVRSDAELQVTEAGQVHQLPGSRSFFDLCSQQQQRLATRRPPLSRQLVRRVTGVRQLMELAPPKVDTIIGDSVPEHIVIQPETGIVLPALHWPGGDNMPVLIATDSGMNTAVANAQQLHGQGHPVMVVDVRDTGETKTRNWRFHGADYYIGYMLGRNWLSMRTEDLLVCARWLSQRENSTTVQLSASGEIGPAALHAAALHPELISALHTERSLASWQELMVADDAHSYLHNSVHGALEYYDLPDLKKLLHQK